MGEFINFCAATNAAVSGVERFIKKFPPKNNFSKPSLKVYVKVLCHWLH
jgi:hypothetical protein